jgi:hypothetical protein
MSSMSPEAVALVGGLLFLLIAVVGGGFTAKEIAIPGVPGWGRIASLAVGVALVVPYFSEALRSDAAPLPDARIAASTGDSAAVSGSTVHDARDRLAVSRDGLEVSGLLATTDGSEPAVGDSIEVAFTLRNAGTDAVSLTDAFVGVRTPGDENGDFANADEPIVLQPGETIDVGGSRVFDGDGLWTLFPCYQLATGKYCPDEWRAFQVLVQR